MELKHVYARHQCNLALVHILPSLQSGDCIWFPSPPFCVILSSQKCYEKFL